MPETRHLQVLEQDLSPDVLPVHKIVVPSGTEVDNSDGSIDLDWLNETASDLLYLRLDATNDPITGDLHIADGNGLIIGHTSQIDFGAIPEFQVLGTGTPDSSMGFARFEDNASGPDVRFLKSRGATIGTNTIVQDGDTLGRIRFQGADTLDFNTTAAQLLVKVDGSPASNDIPGRFVWETRVSGGSLAERMTLSDAGDLGIGTASPDTLLHLSDATTGSIIRLENRDTSVEIDDIIGTIEFEQNDVIGGSGVHVKILGIAESSTGALGLAFETGTAGSSTERMRIDNSGKVGIGTNAPAVLFHVQGTSQVEFVIEALAGNPDFTYVENGNTKAQIIYDVTNNGVMYRVNDSNAGGIVGLSGVDRFFISGTADDVHLPNDNGNIFFGAAQDAGITYDGTDLLVTPNVVGSGSLKVVQASSIRNTKAVIIDHDNSNVPTSFATSTEPALFIDSDPSGTLTGGTTSKRSYGVRVDLDSAVIVNESTAGHRMIGFKSEVSFNGTNTSSNELFALGFGATVAGNLGTTGTTRHVGYEVTSVTGTADNNYGILITTVSGATLNFGIWDDSGADWVLDADSQKIIWGDAQDSEIYHDGSNFIIDPDPITADQRVLIGATGDDDMLLNDIEIDGDLNHDGSAIGFFGTVPASQVSAYSPTNVSTDRAYDADSTTIDEIADVLGTLIADLQTYGLLQ